MEQKSDPMRERLLSHLPQPENLAAYREEVSSLLAKHNRALLWERRSNLLLVGAFFAAFWVLYFILGPKPNSPFSTPLQILLALAVFIGITNGVREFIYRNHVDLLKEVKQVQLQILELQLSLRRNSTDRHP